jgi:nicotinamidase-related amidase
MSTDLRLRREGAMLLVIDLQTRLLPHVEGPERVVGAATALVRGAQLFGIPVLATVQYVKGLGPTHECLTVALRAADVEPIEKMSFSVCGCDEARTRLDRLDRPQVLVTGVEAHVCVAQTVLDLLATGRQPFVCADAVSSRYADDRQTALRRMRQAGAVITTTEGALFELCNTAGTPHFKELLGLVKTFDEVR